MIKKFKNPIQFFLLFLSCVIFFAFQLAAHEDSKNTDLAIVFVGNSITHGATLEHPETDAPPAQACSMLRKMKGISSVRFSNQGVSGFTTVDFLPSTKTAFDNVTRAANVLKKDKKAQLIFSIMLGTNDSAIKGPNGSPVSEEEYYLNLHTIIEQLLHDFPECKIIINRPVWYSPNTYNSSQYLQEGLTRLQSYFPQIDSLVKTFDISNPRHVFKGDTAAFRYFKKHPAYLTPESGHAGTFYLHPNKEGAKKLAEFWSNAIYKMAFSDRQQPAK